MHWCDKNEVGKGGGAVLMLVASSPKSLGYAASNIKAIITY